MFIVCNTRLFWIIRLQFEISAEEKNSRIDVQPYSIIYVTSSSM